MSDGLNLGVPSMTGLRAEASRAALSSGSASSVSQADTIRKNAQEFENILVRQMLRELRQSPFAPEGDSMKKAYLDMADEQLASHISASGGLGFGKAMAEMMLKQIKLSGLINSTSSSVNPSTTQP